DVLDLRFERRARQQAPYLARSIGQTQHDLRLVAIAERTLRLLGELQHLRTDLGMRAQPLGQVAEDLLRETEVEIVATETGIAVGCEHLEDAAAQAEN